MEQPDGTFVAWAGPVRRTASITLRTRPSTPTRPELALKRKSGHGGRSPRCSEFEMRTHTMLIARPVKRLTPPRPQLGHGQHPKGLECSLPPSPLVV